MRAHLSGSLGFGFCSTISRTSSLSPRVSRVSTSLLSAAFARTLILFCLAAAGPTVTGGPVFSGAVIAGPGLRGVLEAACGGAGLFVLLDSAWSLTAGTGAAGDVSAGGGVAGAGGVCVSWPNANPRDNPKVVRVSHEVVFIMRQVEILSRVLSMFAICPLAIVRV
jgi:hypothetical protein